LKLSLLPLFIGEMGRCLPPRGFFVEASFMMMNQVDSSSFDDDKDDDKKPRE